QMLLLHREQLPRHGAEMLLICRVDAVAPLPRLLVHILPTGEAAPRQEVPLDKPERPFDPGRTVGVTQLVSDEAEAEALCKSRHLGHRNHRPPGAAQHHDMSVVDHYAFGRTVEVAQSLNQEDLAIEALEGWIQLEEQHVRVTQNRRGGLHLAPLDGGSLPPDGQAHPAPDGSCCASQRTAAYP